VTGVNGSEFGCSGTSCSAAMGSLRRLPGAGREAAAKRGPVFGLVKSFFDDGGGGVALAGLLAASILLLLVKFLLLLLLVLSTSVGHVMELESKASLASPSESSVVAALALAVPDLEAPMVAVLSKEKFMAKGAAVAVAVVVDGVGVGVVLLTPPLPERFVLLLLPHCSPGATGTAWTELLFVGRFAAHVGTKEISVCFGMDDSDTDGMGMGVCIGMPLDDRVLLAGSTWSAAAGAGAALTGLALTGLVWGLLRLFLLLISHAVASADCCCCIIGSADFGGGEKRV
jgi:hypothetical protein